VELAARGAQEPVVFDEAVGQWFVFTYDDICAALADPRLTVDRMHRFAERVPPAVVDALRAHAAWIVDPEGDDFEWVRPVLRSGLQRMVGSRRRRAIAATAEALLDDLLATDAFDVVGDYAWALSGRVLADFLGVDSADGRRLMGWAWDFVAFFDDLEVRVDTTDRMARSAAAMAAYAQELLAEGQLRDGVLAQIAEAAAAKGHRLDDETVGNLMLPLLIGQVPVAQLVANCLWLLLAHADQRSRLAERPNLLAGAIEETLRYMPPGPLAGRIAVEPFALRGWVVEPMQTIQLAIGAANRDPARFRDPDRFDIARRPGGALTFGHGPHSCLGAGLARMQAATGLQALLRRAPDLALDPGRPVVWSELPGLLGPRELSVRPSAEPAARPAR
jgi:cytochrome P450